MNSVIDQLYEFVPLTRSGLVIPMITDPLGQHWQQPMRMEIQLDTKWRIAYMNKRSFDKLAEYSCSLPSGKYVGKMWKCNDYAFSRLPEHQGKELWKLCWYDVDPDPKYLKIHSYTLIII